MELRGKIIVILGPTSSGKSDVAVRLAKKFNGEVISADSRQIYRRMNIGTGKIEPDRLGEIPIKFAKSKFSSGSHPFISDGIPHHMIDIVNPSTDYNVAKFKKAADKIIADILKRGKLPIICGGTGFWIKAIVDDVKFPAVKPDWKLRQKLSQHSTFQLFEVLKCLDSQRSKTIDKNNKVRLIRAIEICKTIGKVPLFDDLKKLGFPALPAGRSRPQQPKEAELLKFLQIGIDIPKEKLYQNIKKRLDARFKQGMIREVKDLHFKYKVSWKRLEGFGLEYKRIALYLQNKISKDKIYPVKSAKGAPAPREFNRMEEKLLQEIKNYAKRQMTWFKKDKRINWLKNYPEIEKETRKFIKK